jgi:hypothetical protein
MLKKLTLLGMAIAAMAALVAPATAGATELTEGGARVPVGSEITLTQDPSNHVITESTTLGEIKCNSITIHGKVTKNDGSEVVGSGTEGTAAPCFVEGEEGAEVTSVTGTIASHESGKGTANFNFVIDIPNLPEACTFTTPSPANGTFVTGSNTIEFPAAAPAELEGSPAFCGEGELHGGLILETKDGTPDYLS